MFMGILFAHVYGMYVVPDPLEQESQAALGCHVGRYWELNSVPLGEQLAL